MLICWYRFKNKLTCIIKATLWWNANSLSYNLTSFFEQYTYRILHIKASWIDLCRNLLSTLDLFYDNSLAICFHCDMTEISIQNRFIWHPEHIIFLSICLEPITNIKKKVQTVDKKNMVWKLTKFELMSSLKSKLNVARDKWDIKTEIKVFEYFHICLISIQLIWYFENKTRKNNWTSFWVIAVQIMNRSRIDFHTYDTLILIFGFRIQ